MSESFHSEETWEQFSDRIQSHIRPESDESAIQKLQFEYSCRALKESATEREVVKQRLKWIPVWVVTGITAVLGVAAAAGKVDPEWVYGGVAADGALIWYYWQNRIGFQKLFNKADIERFEHYVEWYLAANSADLEVRMMAMEAGVSYGDLDCDRTMSRSENGGECSCSADCLCHFTYDLTANQVSQLLDD